ncbi:MAG TPA: DUF1631 family protein [Candidatus Limiplasma sp.]|nr:DUF1631 family protein [Candidatus Limiplasma sp.]
MRSIAHVKQDMLAQLRQVTPPGQSPTLSPEHNDIVELLSLLFENISREFTPTSPAAQLLAKLQVPMLRVALSDKGFFTRRQHPARLMLNAVAETGATWLRDGEDLDQGLLDKLNVVVDKVTHEFNDDPAIFESTVGDLEQQMQTQARKAEVAERRHVEAARGKERLALARQGAEAAVAAVLIPMLKTAVDAVTRRNRRKAMPTQQSATLQTETSQAVASQTEASLTEASQSAALQAAAPQLATPQTAAAQADAPDAEMSTFSSRQPDDAPGAREPAESPRE